MSGEYCSHCGEQRLSPELRSVKHIVKDLFTDITSVDGKVWNSIITLLFKPGQLDYDYHIGKRIGYLKPVTMFLLINVLFVMFSPITDFYLSFYDQLNSQMYSSFTKPYVLEYIAQQQASVEAYQDAYDQLVAVLARSLIILQVPVFGLLVGLICWRKHIFSGDYLIYALNVNSWVLVWVVFIQVPALSIGYVGKTLFDVDVSSFIFFLSIPLGIVTYMCLSAHKLFRFPIWGLVLRAPLLMVAFLISHLAFRFLQLFITLALVNV